MTALRTRLDNLSNRGVLLILLSLALLVFGLSAFFHSRSAEVDWLAWADSAFQNLGTEFVGALITFWLIEILVGGRNEREDLFAEIRVADNQTALNILNKLRTKRISLAGANLKRANLAGANLHNTNLVGANLFRANLGGADLESADLKRANLEYANLYNAQLKGASLEYANLVCVNLGSANLFRANLEYADLEIADLKGADLVGANLPRVNLKRANLVGANLYNARLKGASLEYANLEGADLEGAEFTTDTTLPDGTNWTSGTDMRRFTYPEHPNFWQAPKQSK